MKRRIILVVVCACVVGAAGLACRLIASGTLEGTLEIRINASPVARDIAGSKMILSYSNAALDVVHNATSPCGNATWTRMYRVRLGESILVNMNDGEHHVILGVEKGTPQLVCIHWERRKGQKSDHREIEPGMRVFATAYDADIILFDCRTVPPLRYTPDNITLARTLSNVSEKEMDRLLRVANMTPEERQQGQELR